MSEVRRQAALLQRPNWGWQDEAACRGREVVLFFGPDGERQPERDVRERKAKAVPDYTCPKCGFENPLPVKFCGECGARIVVP